MFQRVSTSHDLKFAHWCWDCIEAALTVLAFPFDISGLSDIRIVPDLALRSLLSPTRNADTYPLLPQAGGVYYVGEWCRTSWTNENGPGWNSTKIQLMSGLETPILNVANNIDTSKKNVDSIVFRCPDVTK